jgi:plasmid maintenance system antidote protein VapI
MIQRFIEVPNTDIKELVLSHQYAPEMCLAMAEQYGYAETVWYALNGTRVVEGVYGDLGAVGVI